MDARTPPPRLHLDAELRPHRSLSRKGAILLLTPVVFVNLVFAVFFLVLGAPIVPPFMGLDVVALALALTVSFRSGRAVERVRVSADEISVGRGLGQRIGEVWTSPTLFTRVEVKEPGGHSVCVRLVCKGREIVLAAALSPREREAFGRQLEAAVKSALGERWTS